MKTNRQLPPELLLWGGRNPHIPFSPWGELITSSAPWGWPWRALISFTQQLFGPSAATEIWCLVMSQDGFMADFSSSPLKGGLHLALLWSHLWAMRQHLAGLGQAEAGRKGKQCLCEPAEGLQPGREQSLAKALERVTLILKYLKKKKKKRDIIMRWWSFITLQHLRVLSQQCPQDSKVGTGRLQGRTRNHHLPAPLKCGNCICKGGICTT